MTDRALRPSPLGSGKPRTEVAEFLDQLQAKLPTTVKSAVVGSTFVFHEGNDPSRHRPSNRSRACRAALTSPSTSPASIA